MMYKRAVFQTSCKSVRTRFRAAGKRFVFLANIPAPGRSLCPVAIYGHLTLDAGTRLTSHIVPSKRRSGDGRSGGGEDLAPTPPLLPQPFPSSPAPCLRPLLVGFLLEGREIEIFVQESGTLSSTDSSAPTPDCCTKTMRHRLKKKLHFVS